MSYAQGAKTYLLPANLLVAMLNTSFLKTHAANIASDWRIMDNFIFFPTETHLSLSSNLNEIQAFLDQCSITFDLSNYRFSSIAISYQKSILLQCHQKGESISVVKLCKPTYSNGCVSIAILYRWQ